MTIHCSGQRHVLITDGTVGMGPGNYAESLRPECLSYSPGFIGLLVGSGQSGLASQGEGFDGGATGTGGVAVGHDVDGDAGLFFALRGHPVANFLNKPTLEARAGFDSAAADDEGVGIEGIDHLVEKEAERVGLDAEDFFAEGVALVGEAANELRGLMNVRLGEFVAGIAREKIREDVTLDGGERAQGLEIAEAAAVAARVDAGDTGDALIRDEDVAELAAETVFALHDFAVEDDAAAIAGPDDDRDGRFAAVGAEDGVVTPEGSGVGVVQIANGLVQLTREALANVEASPFGMNEIRRPTGAELAGGACWTRSVETHCDDV